MRLEDQAAAYFSSSQALKSDDPAVRRAAISTLIDLAHRASTPIRARASAILAKEFGPYAVTEGLSGCTAPISTAEPRIAPRWSVVMGVVVPGKSAVVPAPMAALPGRSVMVWVGPP